MVFDSISLLKEKGSFKHVSWRLISSDSIFAGWFSALLVIMVIFAELLWEVPSHLSFVDSCDFSGFCLCEHMLWSDPENTADVSPA